MEPNKTVTGPITLIKLFKNGQYYCLTFAKKKITS